MAAFAEYDFVVVNDELDRRGRIGFASIVDAPSAVAARTPHDARRSARTDCQEHVCEMIDD